MAHQPTADNEEAKKFLDVIKPDEDIIEKTIGPIGRWQIFVSFICCLVKFPVAWVQLTIVFLAPPTTFTCYDNETEQCSENCTSHVFDRSMFSESIITQWDLVCDKAYMANLVQTVTMLGILSGNIIFGFFSDRFGRRAPLVAAVVLQIVSGIGAGFVPWFEVFLVLRFLVSWATGGTMVMSFVLVMEIVGSEWRTPFGILYQIPFSLGHLTLPLFAYFIRDWRYLHVAICLPSVLLLSYYFILPESPRWLLSVGRSERAIKTLEKAAHHNGLPVDGIKENVQKLDTQTEHKGGNILDLVRTSTMCTYTICLGFNWFSAGICFFGGAQYVGQLGGNMFLNVAFSAIIQVPGTVFSIWALKSWGRKKTLIFSQLTAGVSSLLLAVAPQEPIWIQSILSCISMFALAIAFPTSYIYSGELYPTVVRNVGVGFGSMFARVGSMVAPFVAGLAVVKEWLPMTVFGVMPLVGAILVLQLPETVNCRLPDTVEEAEKLGKK